MAGGLALIVLIILFMRTGRGDWMRMVGFAADAAPTPAAATATGSTGVNP
jgi:hypothetical protein